MESVSYLTSSPEVDSLGKEVEMRRHRHASPIKAATYSVLLVGLQCKIEFLRRRSGIVFFVWGIFATVLATVIWRHVIFSEAVSKSLEC